MLAAMKQTAVFLREFVRNFHTTGAILPSGRFLARALARNVAPLPEGRRICEVGPGTGSVTEQIIKRLGPNDRLDLVELNDAFVEGLRRRLAEDALFRPVADRVRVFHCPVQQMLDRADERYDLIISGLPLNNFSAELVNEILDVLLKLLRPGGAMSFFEYIAIRRVRGLISGPNERRRLRGIDAALKRLFADRRVQHDRIWLNVPPAWVHHVWL